MRIISGSLKGRIIPNVYNIKNVLPSSDILKGALFNVLGKNIENRIFCDLFAGSGNVGFEAISRGASFCVFVETSSLLTASIINTASKFKVQDRVKIIKKDVIRAIEKGDIGKYNPDFIFMDPPYDSNMCEKAIRSLSILPAPFPEIIIQHEKAEELSGVYSPFRLVNRKGHGRSCLSFYSAL